MPPAGDREHEYLVQLHALDQDLGLAPGFDGEAVIPEIEASSIGTVSLVGRLQRRHLRGAAAASTSRRSGRPTRLTTHGQHRDAPPPAPPADDGR